MICGACYYRFSLPCKTAQIGFQQGGSATPLSIMFGLELLSLYREVCAATRSKTVREPWLVKLRVPCMVQP